MTYRMEFDPGNSSIFQRFSWIQASREWANEMGPIVEAELRAEAPVGKGTGSGRLRDSIKFRRASGLSSIALEFGSDVPYASYVENGTAPHVILPRNARRLRFVARGGDLVYSAMVNHPGTKPNPFARNAMMRLSPLIAQSFKDNVEAQFRKA
jgi:HK97 gp10 family phage protein